MIEVSSITRQTMSNVAQGVEKIGARCRERGYYMKKNQGMSLVELIVVIGIMGVVVGLVGISFAVVTRQRVSSAATDVKGQLQTAQTIAMSRDDCYVEVRRNASGEVVFTTYSSATKKLDTYTVDSKIQVKLQIGSAIYNLKSDTGTFVISYQRESGSMKDTTRNGTYMGVLRRIEFTDGKKTSILNVNKVTGKVSFE